MKTAITKERAIELLKEHNKEPFHILHGLTVGAVLRWYANELGYGEDADFWEVCGILHDIDFEEYPDEHCIVAPRLLEEAGAEEELIHAVVSHGYGHRVEVKPEDGQVWVTEATCPDKICIHQGKISQEGETIVCLPNRMIIQIFGE